MTLVGLRSRLGRRAYESPPRQLLCGVRPRFTRDIPGTLQPDDMSDTHHDVPCGNRLVKACLTASGGVPPVLGC